MSDEKSDCVQAVIPMLVCRDGASEIDFCMAAFSAEELSRRTNLDGEVVHAALKIGEALIFVHGEFPALGSLTVFNASPFRLRWLAIRRMPVITPATLPLRIRSSRSWANASCCSLWP